MIKPHGSEQLHPLFVDDTQTRLALMAEAENLPSLLVNSAAAANAVMLAGGYFNPLTGYMNLADALSVAETMHTTDGLFFPVPIVNMTDDPSVAPGSRIALRDPNVEGNPVLAIMDVEAAEVAKPSAKAGGRGGGVNKSAKAASTPAKSRKKAAEKVAGKAASKKTSGSGEQGDLF